MVKGRSSDFRFKQSVAPSHSLTEKVTGSQEPCDDLAGYSGGSVTDLHRLPFSLP